MNATVLIATHSRLEITTRNIRSLLNQSVKPKIILVITDRNEYEHYKSIDPTSIYIEFENNKPLGNKWQSGADKAMVMNADPLIITGSDDILGDGFIENACRLVREGNHFIGLRQWWQHKDGKAYCCQYMAKNNQALGGGRVFSGEMLRALNYKLFDTTANKHLDDLAAIGVQKSGLKCLILDEPQREGLSIHAIKGNWQCLNPFTLHHPNLRLIRTVNSVEVLPSFFKLPVHSQ